MEVIPIFLDLLRYRVKARPSGLQSIELSETAEVQTEEQPSPTEQAGCLSELKTETYSGGCESSPSDSSPELIVGCENMPLTEINPGVKREQSKDVEIIDVNANDSVCNGVESSYMHGSEAVKDLGDIEDLDGSNTCSSVLEEISVCKEEQDDSDLAKWSPTSCLPNGFSCVDKNSSVSMDYENAREDSNSKHVDVTKCKVTANGFANHNNSYVSANNYDDVPVEDGDGSFPIEMTPSAEKHQFKGRLASDNSEGDKGNGVKNEHRRKSIDL
ncbi:unnamed protein product [Sphenostylis stenocarpa]|uniref:Uncharacterized protein n=1 Tax=Sphenostylis stenocarpa TaxID=92480 RepID=A0AA86SZ31_9FABA|nr:unnamed protein product [Sphenostylis stenocarpa]